MSTDTLYFSFSPYNVQYFYEQSVIFSNFWTARIIFFIVLSTCIQNSETHLIFQNKALLYQQCIQVSSDLRHTNIFRVYQKLTYIHVSAYIQGSKTQFIFQSMAVLYHQFIHVSKYPAI